MTKCGKRKKSAVLFLGAFAVWPISTRILANAMRLYTLTVAYFVAYMIVGNDRCFAAERTSNQIDRSVMSDRYWEIWNNAEQARIDADIEKYRKADGMFAVTAADGSDVEVEQLENEFRFGAHIFNYNQLGNHEYNERYKAMYGKGGLFNQGTVSFYWIDHEQTPGAFRFGGGSEDGERYWNSMTLEERRKDRNWRRPAPGPVIDFLRAKGLSVHGHCVIWGNGKPYWIYDWFCPEAEKQVADSLGIPRHSEHYGWEPTGRNVEMGYMGKWCDAWRHSYSMTDERELAAVMPIFTQEMRRIFRKRVLDVGAAYGRCVDSWDIVNESACDWMRYRSSKTDLPVWFSNWGLMPGDYPLNAFLDAKEAFPASTKLAINDFKIDESYVQQAKEIVDAGGKIDMMGLQMHIFNTNDSLRLSKGYEGVLWIGSPRKIRDTLDRMARFGRPLHISEVTIASPGEDERSRKIQAILVRNIYRAWFSHPSTMGITWWNTVDGAGVAGEPLVSGLYTDKMEKKPAYNVLDELINSEWTTRIVVKAKDGVVSFRGFRGRYCLSWKCRDCCKVHKRFVVLTEKGNVETSDSWKSAMCRISAHDFWVDGKNVRIDSAKDLLDLNELYPGEVRKGEDGRRVATVRFNIRASSSGRFPIFWHNDYYGEISVNGGNAKEVEGPWFGFEKMYIDLNKGENAIEFKTRAGSGGKWTIGFQIPATVDLMFAP